MNPWGLSPSSFYPDESQVGEWKMDPMHGNHGSKTLGTFRMPSVTSSSLENRLPADPKMAKGFDHPEYYFSNQNSNALSGNFFSGAGAVSHSLPSAADHAFSDRINLNAESASYCFDGDKINRMDAQSENSLFSSSLSDIFNRKLRLPSNKTLCGHFEEVEGFESLEKSEAQTIVNLPDDDDLFSGVTNGLDALIRSNDGEDMEDLDLFSHVGGLELGEDSSSWRNSVPSDLNSNNEHPFGGLPSRTLFVRNINSNVEDSELHLLFEKYGDIRTLYTACKHLGFVMVSYYDIRAACNAMKALQNKPLRHRELDIHFSIPKDNSSEKDINQATVGVFNLNSSVSNDKLREIFGVYGEIKEIRDAPNRSQHKFVEFYDVRAAQSAHRSLKRSDIAGKQTMLEPGPSGGSKRLMRLLSSELEQEEFGVRLPVPQHSSSYLATGFSGSISVGGTSSSIGNGPIQRPRSKNGGSVISTFLDHNGISSSVPDGLANQTNITESGHLRDQMSFGSPNFRPHSLPEYHDGLANGTPFGPPGRHHLWSSNSHHPQSQSIAWPSSPSFINGIGTAPPQQLPSHLLNAFHPLSNHHVGSAPAVNQSMWDRRHSYAGESFDAAVHIGISGTAPHPLEYVPHNIFPRTGGNCMDVKTPSKGIGLLPHHQRCMIFPAGGGQMVPMMSSSFDSPNERAIRNRRHEGRSSSNNADSKKQFELDIDRILRGEDMRTTLMIKNIPNKYTSKMLLAAIDELHRGIYDFIYLPIDFKNKCNVGYAFINITDPSLIVPFYQTINGKKWEKFNSEKVATLAYARIQGRASLIAHFQNSSLMNEDKRCRPILFHTDGPNAGDQLPFPMGNNIRPRSGKIRANTSYGENNQEMPLNSVNGEDFTYGDSSSGSGKDSD